MFERLKLWLVGSSGLKQATREGLLEGIRLGMEDALDRLTEASSPEVEMVAIEAKAHSEPPTTLADIRGMKKAELIDLALSRGIAADEGWTVAELRTQLTQAPS